MWFNLQMLTWLSARSTDDDIDVKNLPHELELYSNRLRPPSMQRGRVEGQEIPAAVSLSLLSSPFLLCILFLHSVHHWSHFCT